MFLTKIGLLTICKDRKVWRIYFLKKVKHRFMLSETVKVIVLV